MISCRICGSVSFSEETGCDCIGEIMNESRKNFDDVNFKKFMMPIFAVYHGASDFEPDDYVVRLFDLKIPTMYCTVSKTLEEARNTIPMNMIMMRRSDNDDPHIVEVWL